MMGVGLGVSAVPLTSKKLGMQARTRPIPHPKFLCQGSLKRTPITEKIARYLWPETPVVLALVFVAANPSSPQPLLLPRRHG